MRQLVPLPYLTYLHTRTQKEEVAAPERNERLGWCGLGWLEALGSMLMAHGSRLVHNMPIMLTYYTYLKYNLETALSGI